MRLLPVLALSFFTPLAMAQLQGKVLVAAEIGSTTLLQEVDLQTGAITFVPQHPSAMLYPPLAIATDHTNRTTLIAHRVGNQSLIVRVANGFLIEQVLGTVNGLCTELLVDDFGDVLVAIGSSNGGIWRVPRHGGTPTLRRALPHTSAIGSWWHTASYGAVATSGTATVAPSVGMIDFQNNQWLLGPTPFPGFTPLGITGILDLPTALVRHLLAHDNGTFSLAVYGIPGNPTPVSSTPVLPNGGIAAMRMDAGALPQLLLGGAANPFLYTFDPLASMGGSLVLTAVSLPILGTPVDYAVRPDQTARVLTFGPGCGTAAELRIGSPNTPTLGNPAFNVLLYQALPFQGALLIVGFNNYPVTTFPNGCAVTVQVDALFPVTTNANGDASLAFAIPSATALIGTCAFAQWAQMDTTGPAMLSPVLSAQLGN